MRSKRFNESVVVIGSDIAVRLALHKRNRLCKASKRKAKREDKGND